MRKKSKLTEKPARFTLPSEEKRKDDLKIYQAEITSSNIETARALRFSMLLRDWFASARPAFVEDYLKGVEKYVKIKQKDFIIRGHIDALYGNAVIEFEGDLKKKLNEAKKQLQDYIYCILSDQKERSVNYLCIASDGVQFYVFTPHWKKIEDLPADPEEIELREIDRADFSTIEANEAFLWLDRYFFRHTLLHPTSENFVRDFGINSPAYVFATKLLQVAWRALTGKSFQKLGIVNFLEEDFLSWVAREKLRETLVELTRRISTLLEKYHLEEISEDVLKSLYQELVDPQTRHDLGEFYTPDWLADHIIQHALKSNPEAKVLDPASGSGSFLYFAIRYKREKLGDSKRTLDHIRDNVVGMDIHPLAVTIAKTNYLLALGDLLLKRPKDFSIPVYMANSLRIPERGGQPTLEERVPSIYVELDNTLEPVPEVFIQHPAAFDEAIETCHRSALQNDKADFSAQRFITFAKRRITEAKVDEVTLEILYNVAKRMRELIKKERNSIWTFILKNVYKPVFLQKQFDGIIGNPPWLSYRHIEKGKYQEFVKSAILNLIQLKDRRQAVFITAFVANKRARKLILVSPAWQK